MRQVVVRFSDAELDAVCSRAEARGLAVGAWIGDVAVRAAHEGQELTVSAQRDLLQELIAARPGVVGDLASVVDELIDVLVERLS
ncbi:MAG: hypothetical protein BGP03_31445 [Pseudonocardia sp. 73-21]|nr:MAG: hypothetical protein BGP03_31445 [Pseudonocardia sp. 73-21]